MIDRTYIVNLERRTDKKRHMEKEMDKMKKTNPSLNPVFFKAVDGTDPKILSQYQFNIPNWFDPNSGKAMTNGEVGCALSHYSVWKEFVNDVKNGVLQPHSKILIVEDDVVFPLDFMNKLIQYSKEIKTEYDMLYVHRKPLNLGSETKISVHINKARKSYWTCGYILTYGGAKKLVNAQYLDNLIPVDEFLPIMYGCNIFGYEKLFAECDKLECFAVCPNLLKLTGNAFNDSETFHSLPYQQNKRFVFDNDKEFVVLYIGPTRGDSFKRFTYYCKLYCLPCIFIDNSNGASSTKLLFDELNSWPKERISSTLVLAISIYPTDFCHVIPVASPTEIIDKYKKIVTKNNVVNNNILVTNNYDSSNKKIMVCGWAGNILNFVDISLKTSGPNTPLEMLLVLGTITNKNILSDTESLIFHSLNTDPTISFNHKSSRVNSDKNTPSIIIGNNKTNIILNRVENYTGNNWNEYYGYRISKQNDVQDKTAKPKIYLSFYLGASRDILNIIERLDYPKDLLEIHINRVGSINKDDNIVLYPNENDLLVKDLEKFLASSCDYYFFVNQDCVLENSNVLTDLLELNKDVVAPLLRRGNDNYTNFWGDLDKNGYYKRSPDYFDIIEYERQGCWNVPYISSVYLFKKNVVEKVSRLFLDNVKMDSDMRMCNNLRDEDIFIHVSNMDRYGYIIKESDLVVPTPVVDATTNTFVPKPNPTGEVTLYELFTRRADWEKKYLHTDYYQYRNAHTKISTIELCDGIYDFPLFSEIFCKELMQRSEEYGKWSKGKDDHNDPRLGRNYYENVPTVDIQLFEMGLDKHWHEIVFSYIAPMAKVLYNNYKTKDINLAFVVKYDVKNQQSLAPHHDASTYTVNVALNRGKGIDYDGGGCRFIRQNFILKDKEPGNCTIHPGRLTAYHEGLPVISGTRYILVSFIN